ncbi:MAG: hypothetical protein HQQ73_10390 [Desulfobulbaceae bacterium]|nr:hypothetical protein [Desulfobulbaceae bacterium]
MKDIQNQHDSRRINIRKVGVKGVSYPVIVLDKAHRAQKTVALVNMYVNLPHHFKGTHMSRFVEILNRFHDRFTLAAFQRILEEMKDRLNAEAAHLEMGFPYFFTANKKDQGVLARYNCRLYGSLATSLDLIVEVDVPIATRSSADDAPDNAPGLWGQATVSVRMHRFLWIEDLIALIEEALVSAHSQPPTVKNGCAAIEAALQASQAFSWYTVFVKNQASGYASFAACEWPDDGPASAHGLQASSFAGPLAAHNLSLVLPQ